MKHVKTPTSSQRLERVDYDKISNDELASRHEIFSEQRITTPPSRTTVITDAVLANTQLAQPNERFWLSDRHDRIRVVGTSASLKFELRITIQGEGSRRVCITLPAPWPFTRVEQARRLYEAAKALGDLGIDPRTCKERWLRLGNGNAVADARDLIRDATNPAADERGIPEPQENPRAN